MELLSLVQVVLDLGRRPEARFLGVGGGEYLRDAEVGKAEGLLLHPHISMQSTPCMRSLPRMGWAQLRYLPSTLQIMSNLRSQSAHHGSGRTGVMARVGIIFYI
jgi:hypothetical protein